MTRKLIISKFNTRVICHRRLENSNRQSITSRLQLSSKATEALLMVAKIYSGSTVFNKYFVGGVSNIGGRTTYSKFVHMSLHVSLACCSLNDVAIVASQASCVIPVYIEHERHVCKWRE